MPPRPRLSDIGLMLATPSRPFSSAGWVYEFKYDGYRIVADRKQLATRNKVDATTWYPQIITALQQLPGDFIVDGEVCWVDSDGIPHFEAMRRAATRAGLQLNYYVFDLLWLGRRDLRNRPLLERKELLRELVPREAQRIGYVAHIPTAGKALFTHAVSLGLEGIVAKRADSHYVAGVSRDWRKSKPPGFHHGWDRPLTNATSK